MQQINQRREYPIDWVAISSLKTLVIEGKVEIRDSITQLINKYAKNIFLQMQQDIPMDEDDKKNHSYFWQKGDVLCEFDIPPERIIADVVEASLLGTQSEIDEVVSKLSNSILSKPFVAAAVNAKYPWFRTMVQDFTEVLAGYYAPKKIQMDLALSPEGKVVVPEGYVQKLFVCKSPPPAERLPTPMILDEEERCFSAPRAAPCATQPTFQSFKELFEQLRVAKRNEDCKRIGELTDIFVAMNGSLDIDPVIGEEFCSILGLGGSQATSSSSSTTTTFTTPLPVSRLDFFDIPPPDRVTYLKRDTRMLHFTDAYEERENIPPPFSRHSYCAAAAGSKDPSFDHRLDAAKKIFPVLLERACRVLSQSVLDVAEMEMIQQKFQENSFLSQLAVERGEKIFFELGATLLSTQASFQPRANMEEKKQ